MDSRKPLKPGTKLQTNDGRTYIILREMDRGATSIVYEGAREGESIHAKTGENTERVIIKECYPIGLNLKRNSNGTLSCTAEAFIKFANAQINFDKRLLLEKRLHNKKGLTNFSTTVIDFAESNNSKYLIMDVRDGETFEEYISNHRQTISLWDVVFPIYLLALVVSEYHKEFLILDIKPENFLLTFIDGHPHNIEFFDVGSVIEKNNIKKDMVLSCSPKWAAPELLSRDDYEQINEKTDIYGIGATLFWAIMGRNPDSREFLHTGRYDFNSSDCIECVKTANEVVIRKISKIFDHTLDSFQDARYDSAQQLAEKIKDLLHEFILDKADEEILIALAKTDDKINKLKDEVTVIGEKVLGLEEKMSEALGTRTASSRINNLLPV